MPWVCFGLVWFGLVWFGLLNVINIWFEWGDVGKMLKDNFQFGYHIMKVIFDPFVLPFKCYRQQNNSDTTEADDYHECCVSVKWAPAFFIETCVVISALVLYVLGFVWIVSIEEGVHACMMGGMLPPTDPTGLSSPLKYYSNCMSSACTVSTAVGNMVSIV